VRGLSWRPRSAANAYHRASILWISFVAATAVKCTECVVRHVMSAARNLEEHRPRVCHAGYLTTVLMVFGAAQAIVQEMKEAAIETASVSQFIFLDRGLD
jgi:hypothetical protein